MLQQRAEATGNMSATVDSVIDSENCLSKANLTDNQFIVLQLRWLYNFTLKDCGNILGVSLEAVRQSEELAKTKIQKVLDVWNEEL
ncbi:sigma factor-like helix-turn-helix DNA-binding protein [Melissococcus sp. OM08-11BH]|uniref:sigma factor-like helix-turn-helix DNA-binding protein n=1 Tax=Melissococcus sp. OM08-11BH TaxID=2293110 RepID=UPI0011C0CB12|nr:sigma factor-like helix-turn-helix DNA-binding protein [Melissococcus sp. OM08-11BH]